jgi:hypothetical protein
MKKFKIICILIIWQTFAESIQGLQYHTVYLKVIQINLKTCNLNVNKKILIA